MSISAPASNTILPLSDLPDAVDGATGRRQEWMAAVLQSAQLGWLYFDLQTSTLTTSPLCRENFGLLPDQEFTYERLFDTVHPGDRARLRRAIKEAQETRQDYDLEYRIFWPDNSIHWIHAQGRLMYDEDGKPLGITGLTREITRHKVAQETLARSEARYRALVEQASDAIFITDASATIQYVNPSACAMLGYTQLELVGQNVISMLQPDNIAEVTFNLQRVASGETLMTRRQIRRKDGTPLVIEGTHKRISDGRFVAMVRDITEAKRHEEEIDTLNRRLHRAIYESSHRIKNHLQVLAAMVDMALMDGDETLPAEQFRKLGTNIRALAAIHDTLTLETRSDGATQTVSAEALLNKVLSVVQQASGPNRVTFQVQDTLLPIQTCTALALLVNELASNAIKHGRSMTQVTLITANDQATLTVEDDGNGFPPDFDPIRAANTGLELVDNLSRTDLRGQVRYENRPQSGGRVVVTFPVPAVQEVSART